MFQIIGSCSQSTLADAVLNITVIESLLISVQFNS